MTKADAKQIKGCLEVRVISPSRMGFSDRIIPIGTIGYVLGHRDDSYAIFWPTIAREYKGDWRSGSHKRSDVEPTGKRG